MLISESASMLTISWECSCGRRFIRSEIWAGIQAPCACGQWNRIPACPSGEEWKKVETFKAWRPGTRMYWVSTWGRARAEYWTNKGLKVRLVASCIEKKSGYRKGTLTGERPQQFRVHELVYWTFFGPIPTGRGLVIDHIDPTRFDGALSNALTNLRRTDHSGNALAAVEHGLHPSGGNHFWTKRRLAFEEFCRKMREAESGYGVAATSV
jgi:hypothetical protein